MRFIRYGRDDIVDVLKRLPESDPGLTASQIARRINKTHGNTEKILVDPLNRHRFYIHDPKRPRKWKLVK